MNRYASVCLIALSLPVISPYLILSPVNALEFTAQEFWFFVNSPQTINYTEMIFSVRNTEDHAIRINCSFNEIEGIDLTVFFRWSSIILEPEQKEINRYAIKISYTLASTIDLEIEITQQAENVSGAQATVSGSVINHISFYSDTAGSLLDFRVVDQILTPRNASVLLSYRVNNSYSWTPIKKFNGTSLYGVFPLGFYHALAVDLETGVRGELTFELWRNESLQYLKLPLIDFYINILGGDFVAVEFVISNHKGELPDLSLFAEVRDNSGLVYTTDKITFEPFGKVINQKVFLPIDFNFKNKEYVIVGKLESLGFILATNSQEFTYNKLSRFNLFTPQIILSLSLVSVFMGLTYSYFKQKKRGELNEEKN